MSTGRIIDRRPTGYREHFDIGSDIRKGLSGFATEKEKRIVATRLDLRFEEPVSRELQMMLGIIPSPRDIHAEVGPGLCSCGHQVTATAAGVKTAAARVASGLGRHIAVANRKAGVTS